MPHHLLALPYADIWPMPWGGGARWCTGLEVEATSSYLLLSVSLRSSPSKVALTGRYHIRCLCWQQKKEKAQMIDSPLMVQDALAR